MTRTSVRTPHLLSLLCIVAGALAMRAGVDAARQVPPPLASVIAACPRVAYLPPPDPDEIGVVWGTAKRYQLVIGADQYEHSPELNRPFVRETARLVSAALTQRGFSPLPSFSAEEDKFLSGKAATKERIWAAIEEMRRTLGPSDVGVIYYAGHGSIPPSHADLVLATQDRPVNKDEGIRVSDVIGELSLGEYRTNLLEMPRLILILDTCYSGTAVPSAKTIIKETDGMQQLAQAVSGFPPPDKMTLLTATAPGNANRAFELRDTGYSALGYFLVRALTEDWACADTTADGVLTIREVYQFLRGSLQRAFKAKLLEASMQPWKRAADDRAFLAYDATKYATAGDRDGLVEISASSEAGTVAAWTLPNGETRVCQPICTAVVSKALKGDLLLNAQSAVAMNTAESSPDSHGFFFPPPPRVGVERINVQDLLAKGGHTFQGINITVK